MRIDKNLPNYLTIARIMVIPVIILAFYINNSLARKLGALLFVLASITDFFDGYIARKYNLVTSFGKMFDPIADKLLVGCVIIMLLKKDNVDEIPCLLILVREFLVSGLREFLALVKVSVPVSRLAKVKTFLQMFALSILILGSKGSGIIYLDIVGEIILWIAAFLTIITGYSYFKACKKYF
ncbi:CDP-diacylglycerol--glycerol-3-phosphate 3-phosphatidyltransferase [Rickettsia hoogstraalii]|uniref:CDP-diacylglycerol--glycerol-3-phosphate 3-phosphatidyltransferase n=1 Tax=Rickettsia hoogstraalii TaxID=467174 RepID=UPI00058E5B65|nr:CDP-diacylglycerol--glycerol-3-phosphate 3-phosphatidyltransferase [Rickettsia hoogstraalii]KJV81578.1 CDP-diacylglycerol--glycerol-3-phosphate 3-phosphatidyltransferase [Rickettsia hoogstraalii str. RCCE3]MCX4084400.1 CDP-diacylglycerol--glycerol-3-phosphate 3-phosphatidyltransferase [Rickettsia hoogstraalii]